MANNKLFKSSILLVHLMFNIFFCKDANECQLIGVCENGGSCLNTNGSYACRCMEGWQGQHCEHGLYTSILNISKSSYLNELFLIYIL